MDLALCMFNPFLSLFPMILTSQTANNASPRLWIKLNMSQQDQFRCTMPLWTICLSWCPAFSAWALMFEQARLEHALDHRCGRAATEQPASIKQAHRPTYASDDRESCLRCVVSVLTLVPEFTGDFSQTAVSNLLTEDVLQQILSCSLWLHCRTHAHTHAHTHAYI